MSLLDWDDLRYVLAISRERTLAGASKSLRVDATTVGRRLVAIEEALGARLFDRNADGFASTPAGELVITRAAEVEAQTLALEREVRGADKLPIGDVRLTAIDSFLDGYLVPRLGPLMERHPGLVLTFVSDVRLFDLSRREADIGVRYKKPRQSALVGRRLGSQATAIYAARGYLRVHGRPRGDGAGHRYIGLPKEFDTLPEGKLISDRFPAARLIARASTAGHLLSAARAGLGLAMLDCFVGDLDPSLERAIAEPVLEDELWVVVHSDMHRSARVRAVMDYLSEIVAKDSDLLEGRARRRVKRRR